MKNLFFIVLGFFAISANSFAAETLGEKTEVQTNNVKRAATEQVHRLEEAVCTDSEMECLAKKAMNYTGEAADATVDKATELKNNVD